MAKAKHIQVKDKRQLIILTVAALALVGIILATAVAIVNHRGSGTPSAQHTINSITDYEPISLVEGAEKEGVTDAARCLDANGSFVCYAVTAFGEGFNDRVGVISYLSENGDKLVGIRVSSNLETKNYGKEVEDSPFVQRFEGAKLPVWLYDGSVAEESMGKQSGTKIDALSGATVSSRAVVDAVNTAYTYFQNHLKK